MIVYFYLFFINFITYASSQAIRIEAIFSEDDECSLQSDSISIKSIVPYARNITPAQESCDSDDYFALKDNYHIPTEVCSCVKIVQVINPYKDLSPLKVFNKASMQCAICLSIAKQVQTTLGEYKIGLNNPKLEIARINHGIRNFCRRHFSIVGLRDNLKRFPAVVKLLKFASNEVDENFSLRLNRTCNKYMEHINVVNFYNVLLERTSSISSFLCRKDGVFRDCVNIQLKPYNVISIKLKNRT